LLKLHFIRKIRDLEDACFFDAIHDFFHRFAACLFVHGANSQHDPFNAVSSTVRKRHLPEDKHNARNSKQHQFGSNFKGRSNQQRNNTFVTFFGLRFSGEVALRHVVRRLTGGGATPAAHHALTTSTYTVPVQSVTKTHSGRRGLVGDFCCVCHCVGC
jgi:hypothetical protein